MDHCLRLVCSLLHGSHRIAHFIQTVPDMLSVLDLSLRDQGRYDFIKPILVFRREAREQETGERQRLGEDLVEVLCRASNKKWSREGAGAEFRDIHKQVRLQSYILRSGHISRYCRR